MTRIIPTTKGDTTSIVFTITDSSGVAVNITGYTAYFTIKKDPNDPDARAIITKSWTSHTTPASGITTLSLTSADTNKANGTYFWDLKLKDGSSNITTAGQGSFIINPHQTNSVA